jgi:RND family efflux transporter MFP subunit
MNKLLAGIVIVTALGGGVYWASLKWPDKFAFSKAKAPVAAKPAPSTTALVGTRSIYFAVTSAGEIGPVDTVSVRPEVNGRIDKLPVDIGDKVKKDTMLFTLDDSDLQTEKASQLIEIEGAKLQIESQKIQLEKTKLNYERTKELFNTKLVSQEVYDNARIDWELTGNALDMSKNKLASAEKQLQSVEDKLSKTIIRAPFDCTILTRPVSVGQAVSGSSGVNSGTEVLTIANLSEMIITAHISQTDVPRLIVNQPVDVEVEAVPGLKLIGHVDRIAPQAIIKNGIKGFPTRIILKGAEDIVRPGMTANISIPLVNAENVVAVPLSAVFTELGARFAFVKKDEDKYEKRTLNIGVTDYDFAEVLSGLTNGETVSLIVPAGETTLSSPTFAALHNSLPGVKPVVAKLPTPKPIAGKATGEKSKSGSPKTKTAGTAPAPAPDKKAPSSSAAVSGSAVAAAPTQ